MTLHMIILRSIPGISYGPLPGMIPEAEPEPLSMAGCTPQNNVFLTTFSSKTIKIKCLLLKSEKCTIVCRHSGKAGWK